MITQTPASLAKIKMRLHRLREQATDKPAVTVLEDAAVVNSQAPTPADAIIAPYELTVTVKAGAELMIADVLSSDPYVTVYIGDTKLGTTRVIWKNHLSPQWEETFTTKLYHTDHYLYLRMYDQDYNKSDFMGMIKYQLDETSIDGVKIEKFPLVGIDGTTPMKGTLSFSISIKKALDVVKIAKVTPNVDASVLQKVNEILSLTEYSSLKQCIVDTIRTDGELLRPDLFDPNALYDLLDDVTYIYGIFHRFQEKQTGVSVKKSVTNPSSPSSRCLSATRKNFHYINTIPDVPISINLATTPKSASKTDRHFYEHKHFSFPFSKFGLRLYGSHGTVYVAFPSKLMLYHWLAFIRIHHGIDDGEAIFDEVVSDISVSHAGGTFWGRGSIHVDNPHEIVVKNPDSNVVLTTATISNLSCIDISSSAPEYTEKLLKLSILEMDSVAKSSHKNLNLVLRGGSLLYKTHPSSHHNSTKNSYTWNESVHMNIEDYEDDKQSKCLFFHVFNMPSLTSPTTPVCQGYISCNELYNSAKNGDGMVKVKLAQGMKLRVILHSAVSVLLDKHPDATSVLAKCKLVKMVGKTESKKLMKAQTSIVNVTTKNNKTIKWTGPDDGFAFEFSATAEELQRCTHIKVELFICNPDLTVYITNHGAADTSIGMVYIGLDEFRSNRLTSTFPLTHGRETDHTTPNPYSIGSSSTNDSMGTLKVSLEINTSSNIVGELQLKSEIVLTNEYQRLYPADGISTGDITSNSGSDHTESVYVSMSHESFKIHLNRNMEHEKNIHRIGAEAPKSTFSLPLPHVTLESLTEVTEAEPKKGLFALFDSLCGCGSIDVVVNSNTPGSPDHADDSPKKVQAGKGLRQNRFSIGGKLTTILGFCKERENMDEPEVVIPYEQILDVTIITPTIISIAIQLHRYFGAKSNGEDDFKPISYILYVSNCDAYSLEEILKERKDYDDYRRRMREKLTNTISTLASSSKFSSFSLRKITSIATLVDDNSIPDTVTLPEELEFLTLLEADLDKFKIAQSWISLHNYGGKTDKLAAQRLAFTSKRKAALTRRISRLRLYIILYIDSFSCVGSSFVEYKRESIQETIRYDLKQAKKCAGKFTNDEISSATCRMGYILDICEKRFKELLLYGLNTEESLLCACLDYTINSYLVETVSIMGKFFDTKSLRNMNGLTNKKLLLTTFMKQNSQLSDIVRQPLRPYNLVASPKPDLQLYLNLKTLIGWYAQVVRAEMFDNVDRTLSLWKDKTKDAAGTLSNYTSVSIPWTPARYNDDSGLFYSNIPEDCVSQLSVYLDQDDKDISLNELRELFKDQMSQLDSLLSMAFAKCFVYLGECYFAALQSTSWSEFNQAQIASSSQSADEREGELDQRIEWLCSIVNDAYRINNRNMIKVVSERTGNSERNKRQSTANELIGTVTKSYKIFNLISLCGIDAIACCIFKQADPEKKFGKGETISYNFDSTSSAQFAELIEYLKSYLSIIKDGDYLEPSCFVLLVKEIVEKLVCLYIFFWKAAAALNRKYLSDSDEVKTMLKDLECIKSCRTVIEDTKEPFPSIDFIERAIGLFTSPFIDFQSDDHSKEADCLKLQVLDFHQKTLNKHEYQDELAEISLCELILKLRAFSRVPQNMPPPKKQDSTMPIRKSILSYFSRQSEATKRPSAPELKLRSEEPMTVYIDLLHAILNETRECYLHKVEDAKLKLRRQDETKSHTSRDAGIKLSKLIDKNDDLFNNNAVWRCFRAAATCNQFNDPKLSEILFSSFKCQQEILIHGHGMATIDRLKSNTIDSPSTKIALTTKTISIDMFRITQLLDVNVFGVSKPSCFIMFKLGNNKYTTPVVTGCDVSLDHITPIIMEFPVFETIEYLQCFLYKRRSVMGDQMIGVVNVPVNSLEVYEADDTNDSEKIDGAQARDFYGGLDGQYEVDYSINSSIYEKEKKRFEAGQVKSMAYVKVRLVIPKSK